MISLVCINLKPFESPVHCLGVSWILSPIRTDSAHADSFLKNQSGHFLTTFDKPTDAQINQGANSK